MWPLMLNEVTRQVLYEDMCRYAALTRDPNPIHLDHAFARNTAFGGVIAHGTFCLNLIWRTVRLSLGPLDQRRFTLDIRFLAPVHERDWISTSGKVEAHSAHEARYAVWAEKSGCERVVEGTLMVEPQHP